jgi:integration host factor subunit alpha
MSKQINYYVELNIKHDLLLSGFGKFNVKDKKAGKGRNLRTGEELILDARRVVTFNPSGILRDKVNGS